MPSPLNDTVKLPCGLVFPNRIIKVTPLPFIYRVQSRMAKKI